MAEVQAHGNKYEDHKIRQLTGLSKKQYDKLKKNGYTSSFDLVKGLKVDFNGGIKTTSSNTVCCSDIQRMYGHEDYTLIVGVYDQVDNKKVFHTEYEFYIKKEDFSKLWGNTSVEKLNEYVNKVKAVEYGKEAQTEYQKVAEVWKQGVVDDNALFAINPKVDSKKQRRVQCSLHIDKLIGVGVKYTKKDIKYTVVSGRRKFNK
jgi:hypothetical protein|tara:strand:+ start:65 stop:673 length:609 start_codon:yes stop_codon:yes gene_type:complete